MPTSSAVLFVVFNRPDVTAKVFSAIRDARPSKLYVAADGPRASRQGEAETCQTVRRLFDNIDWPCELRTKFNERNLGCKDGVVAALDWFFSLETEGIILEDDCLPSPDFFRFCDTLLERYRDDARIRHIGGSNFQRGIARGDTSYYFSRMTHIWGWASWRRVWKDYDKNLTGMSLPDIESAARVAFGDDVVVNHWQHIAAELKHQRIDTWDYQLGIANLLGNGLAAIPNVNLVTNLGFGDNATHTHNSSDSNANLAAGCLPNSMVHPKHFLANQEADLFTANSDSSIVAARKKFNRPKNRISRWLKNRKLMSTTHFS